MVKLSRDLLMFHFEIGQSGLASGAPIDDVMAAVYQAFMIKMDENFFNRFRKAFVHRKPFTVPVTGRPEFLQLADDRSPGLFFPLPDPLDEFFSSQGWPVEPLL